MIIQPKARKQLRRMAKNDVIRLLEALKNYEATGNGDVKKMQGVDDAYRLRVGNMRAIFEIIDDMVVLQAGYRGNIYER